MVIPRNPVRLEVDNVAMLEKEMNVHPVEKSQIWMWKENLSVTQRDVVKQAVRSLVHSLSAYIGLSTPNHLSDLNCYYIVGVFLATLVALHFTPVSKSLGHSFGLA